MKNIFKGLTYLFLIFIFTACAHQNKKSRVTGSELIGGSFSLSDTSGKLITEKSFEGKYTLVFFGFTSCPSVCPMGLSTMGRVLQNLPEKISKEIQPIFITVDPERDTPERIKRFIKAFHPRLIGLSGTLEATEDIVYKYRGYYRKVHEKDQEEYLIDHSDIIYLMSKGGKYLGHFSSSMGVDKIKDQIVEILE